MKSSIQRILLALMISCAVLAPAGAAQASVPPAGGSGCTTSIPTFYKSSGRIYATAKVSCTGFESYLRVTAYINRGTTAHYFDHECSAAYTCTVSMSLADVAGSQTYTVAHEWGSQGTMVSNGKYGDQYCGVDFNCAREKQVL